MSKESALEAEIFECRECGEEWLATGDDGKCPFCGSSDTSPKDDGDAAIDAALDKADK